MSPANAKALVLALAAVALVCALSGVDSPSYSSSRLPHYTILAYSLSPGFFVPPAGIHAINAEAVRPLRNARRSYAWRYGAAGKELLAFSTPIQHVVVIYMENRTPEDLFGAYYSATNPATGNTFGHDLDLVDPVAINLTPHPLNYGGNPGHEHAPDFVQNAIGNWGTKGYWFVPTPSSGASEVANYITLIERWAYENHTLQSNEGPSFEAHQYAISAQSGGLTDSDITPTGMVNNPTAAPAAPPTATATPDDVVGTGTCYAGSTEAVPGVDMRNPYPGSGALPTPTASPCNEYPTILDLMASAAPSASPYAQWQYIAKDKVSIWAAPMAVRHLYNDYKNASDVSTQPFAVDPDAENFVLNVEGSASPTPSPSRPFAELAFVTPCLRESDHPNSLTVSDGPQWLAYIVNAIGTSAYWQHTAIIITWDDWGGFYDNYSPSPWPYHPTPPPSPYNATKDPNEWGFRVPLIVISPYIKNRGYISSSLISQGAILNFVETVFSLGHNALHGDDQSNGNNDLTDMFDFTGLNPLPYGTPLPSTFVPNNDGKCPS